MNTKIFTASTAAAVLAALPVFGASFGDGGTALQGVLDSITTNPIGDSSVNVLTDEVPDNSDSSWQVGGSGGSVSTVVIEIAGLAGTNTFGIYDPSNPSTTIELFAGSATTGSMVLLQISGNGSVLVNFVDTGIDFAGNLFGYYLDSTVGSGGGFWYSNSSLNSDGADHMYAYQGVGDTIDIDGAATNFAPGPWNANEYILAWEDLANPGADNDFTDFVVIVESVSPVPDGGTTVSLLGLTLLGLGFGRRVLRKA